MHPLTRALVDYAYARTPAKATAAPTVMVVSRRIFCGFAPYVLCHTPAIDTRLLKLLLRAQSTVFAHTLQLSFSDAAGSPSAQAAVFCEALAKCSTLRALSISKSMWEPSIEAPPPRAIPAPTLRGIASLEFKSVLFPGGGGNFFDELGRTCRNLTAFTLHLFDSRGVSPEALARMIRAQARASSSTGSGRGTGGGILKKLRFSGNGVNIGEGVLDAIAESAPLLEELQLAYLDPATSESGATIADAGMVKIARACPYIRHLDLAAPDEATITDATLVAFAGHSLSYLDLSANSSITDAGLLQLAKRGVARLSELNVSQTKHITDASIVEIVSRPGAGPALRILRLDYLSGRISDKSVCAITEWCPNIETLELSSSAGKISDVGVCAIAERCHCSLTTLALGLDDDDEECGITEVSMMAIAKRCKRLVSLSLEDIQLDCVKEMEKLMPWCSIVH